MRVISPSCVATELTPVGNPVLGNPLVRHTHMVSGYHWRHQPTGVTVVADGAESIIDLIREHVNDNFYGECVECSSKARVAAGSVWPGPSVRWPCDVIKNVAQRAAPNCYMYGS
jgi:hypothetical protein